MISNMTPDLSKGTFIFLWSSFFLRLHGTTQTFTTHAHSHPYEHTYVNLTPMSIFEDLIGDHLLSMISTQYTSFLTTLLVPHIYSINQPKFTNGV